MDFCTPPGRLPGPARQILGDELLSDALAAGEAGRAVVAGWNYSDRPAGQSEDNRTSSMPRTSDLEILIALAYAEGVSRFGDLQLDPRAYASRIRSIIHQILGGSPLPSAISQFMLRLYASDLYLATACSEQAAKLASVATPDVQAEYSRPAWKTFSASYEEFIGELVRLFTGRAHGSPRLTRAALDYLLLPDVSGVSRISGYDGRSSLSTWLRVLFYQAANELLGPATAAESKDAETKTAQPGHAGAQEPAQGSQERATLAIAVARAFRELTAKERLLLLWRYKDGLPEEKIAELLEMGASRIPRFLERTQLKLTSQVGTILGDSRRIGSRDVEGFIRDMVAPDRPA